MFEGGKMYGYLYTRQLSSGFVAHGTTSSRGDRCIKPASFEVTMSFALLGVPSCTPLSIFCYF